MAHLEDLRRIAETLPEAAVGENGQGQLHVLIAEAPEVFFTEPHYDGYPAVLVRLPAIDPDEPRELVTDAWRLRAPKRLQKEAGL